jgi:hypothetical protein
MTLEDGWGGDIVDGLGERKPMKTHTGRVLSSLLLVVSALAGGGFGIAERRGSVMHLIEQP